ncbi:MAG: CBS domain-containing protein [Planctomycetota bacterium]
MQKDVLWESQDDSVQEALTKMQQYSAGYMMIGRDKIPSGIVSKSDLTGIISPYLRPTFAKWRRPLDDATLKIRIKWAMTNPVHTISPQASLVAIMENMSDFGTRCLPVADQKGKVQGIVTVFDLFKAILSCGCPYRNQ